LKKWGLKYMGSITVYSHLQACGILNDHWEGCFRYQELIAYTDTVWKRREQENYWTGTIVVRNNNQSIKAPR